MPVGEEGSRCSQNRSSGTQAIFGLIEDGVTRGFEIADGMRTSKSSISRMAKQAHSLQ